MPRLLALCDSDDVETVVICGCAPFAQRSVQPCGRAFKERFEKSADSDEDEAERKADSNSDTDASPSKEKKKKEKKEKGDEALKLPECLKGEDLYELLEVDCGASADDLKKAYRKICLENHPDKVSAGKTPAEIEAINLHFVKLQECFNVLSDVKKRRKYDSTGEFDDSVPMRLKEGQDFYAVFGAAFKRNAKWSERLPVPQLGDADTPYDKVKSFYNFWFEFESWRDMDALIMEENGEDCFQDLEAAESRDEKRWMEKENASVRKPYLRAERQRIFGFVEVAEKLDPRVKAEKDKLFAEKEAKEAAKEAKRLELARLAQEEEERRIAAEEKEKAARELEKQVREKEKQVRKAARAKLRKLVKDLDLGLAEDPLQEFLLALDPEETDDLTEKLVAGGKKEAVFAAYAAKGVEPIVLELKKAEDEKSTDAGSTSEEVLTPEEAAKIKQEKAKKQKEQEKRRKKEEEAQKIIREEEAKVRAAEKEVRDAKKKVEQEKQDKERAKQQKKEAERLKREEEKKVKDAEKLVEKAKAEKEANAKRAEEQRLKQLAENSAEQEAKLLETRTFEFERDRLFRCEAFDKLDKLGWASVVEASKAAAENPIVASGLAAAAATYDADSEDLLDAQLACLGSFFALGKRPEEGQLALSSGLRSRVKKLRTKICKAASAGELSLEAPAGTEANSEALEQMMLAALGPEVVHPADAAEAAAAAEAAPALESPVKSKKKAKAKAAPADEDLDALLAEFGMEGGEGKKSKKSGKKK